jgi:hypothetical protein
MIIGGTSRLYLHLRVDFRFSPPPGGFDLSQSGGAGQHGGGGSSQHAIATVIDASTTPCGRGEVEIEASAAAALARTKVRAIFCMVSESPVNGL